MQAGALCSCVFLLQALEPGWAGEGRSAGAEWSLCCSLPWSGNTVRNTERFFASAQLLSQPPGQGCVAFLKDKSQK